MTPAPAEFSNSTMELATEALETFHTVAFWNWPENTKPSPENLRDIVDRLREYGGHSGYALAAKILKSSPDIDTCH